MAREILAAGYFGTGGAYSTFTLALQIPNFVRALAAEGAMAAVLVPIFTELDDREGRREAVAFASALMSILIVALLLASAGFFVVAPRVMPLLLGGAFSPHLRGLGVGLSRILFPLAAVLSIQGLVGSVLNSVGEFRAPALAPVAWNVATIAGLIAGHQLLSGDAELYGYAGTIVAGTFVQLAIVWPVLRRAGTGLSLSTAWTKARLGRVRHLALPLVVGTGIFNLDVLMNTIFGARVSEQAPRAIDAAFRIAALPQGLLSVPVAIVFFPAMARAASAGNTTALRRGLADGIRVVLVGIVPAALFLGVLALPVTRLIYERGAFGSSSTQLVATALQWFAVATPAVGVNFILTRALFASQRHWHVVIAGMLNIATNLIATLLLYRPLGIAGPIIGTAVGNIVMTAALVHLLRNVLSLDRSTARLTAILPVTGAAIAACIALLTAKWFLVDSSGASGAWELAGLVATVAVSAATYGLVLYAFRVPEALGAVARVRAVTHAR